MSAAAVTDFPPAAFPDMPATARAALLGGATEKRFAEGDVIFVAGSSARTLYVIVEGRVRVMRGSAGRAHVIHEEGPGGTLGEVPLFQGGPYPATAIAAEATRCLVITLDTIRSAIRADPDVAMLLLARLAGRVRQLVNQLDERTSLGVRERLAALLVQQADAAEASDAPRASSAARASSGALDVTFTLGATQHAVAESLGTVRELVVRGLRELRDEGVIESVGRGSYIVRDRARLLQIAQQEKEYRERRP